MSANNFISNSYRFVILMSGMMFYMSASGQINEQKRDSLARTIEQQTRKVQAYQDSFTRKQDSLMKTRQTDADSIENAFSETHKKNKDFPGNSVLLPIVLAVLLLVFLIWKRRRDREV